MYICEGACQCFEATILYEINLQYNEQIHDFFLAFFLLSSLVCDQLNGPIFCSTTQIFDEPGKEVFLCANSISLVHPGSQPYREKHAAGIPRGTSPSVSSGDSRASRLCSEISGSAGPGGCRRQ